MGAVMLHIDGQAGGADPARPDDLRPLVVDVAQRPRDRRARQGIFRPALRDAERGALDHQRGIAGRHVPAAVFRGGRIGVEVVETHVQVEGPGCDRGVEARIGGQLLHHRADRLETVGGVAAIGDRADEVIGHVQRRAAEGRTQQRGIVADRAFPHRRGTGRGEAAVLDVVLQGQAVGLVVQPEHGGGIVPQVGGKALDVVQQPLLHRAGRPALPPVAVHRLQPVAEEAGGALDGGGRVVRGAERPGQDMDLVLHAIEAEKCLDRLLQLGRTTEVERQELSIGLAPYQNIEIQRLAPARISLEPP